MFDIKTWVVWSQSNNSILFSRTINFASLAHSWSLLLNFFFTRAALLEADVGKGNFCECGHRFHSLHGCAACVVWMWYWCSYRWCGCPHWFNWLQWSHWCSHHLTIRNQQKHRVAIQMKTIRTTSDCFAPLVVWQTGCLADSTDLSEVTRMTQELTVKRSVLTASVFLTTPHAPSVHCTVRLGCCPGSSSGGGTRSITTTWQELPVSPWELVAPGQYQLHRNYQSIKPQLVVKNE